HVARAPRLNHSQQVVARFGYCPRDNFRSGVFRKNCSCRCGSIHLWHVHVHKDQVWLQCTYRLRASAPFEASPTCLSSAADASIALAAVRGTMLSSTTMTRYALRFEAAFAIGAA